MLKTAICEHKGQRGEGTHRLDQHRASKGRASRMSCMHIALGPTTSASRTVAIGGICRPPVPPLQVHGRMKFNIFAIVACEGVCMTEVGGQIESHYSLTSCGCSAVEGFWSYRQTQPDWYDIPERTLPRNSHLSLLPGLPLSFNLRQV